MRLLFGLLGIQSIRGYSMHDLNNNENTWEIAGCHSQPIRAETSEKFIVTSGFPNIYSQRMDCTWKGLGQKSRPKEAPKRAPPKKKQAPKKKKPSAKGDYIKAGIERNLAAEARAKEAQMEREQKKKAQANKVLKKRLVFLIIGLVFVTIGNVWFILHRRKLALQKEAEKLGEKKSGLSSDSCKSDEPIYSSLDQI
ncbi:unnamed protein product [Oikopleura dioica]|uniref:Uncharacterized protein n=1 Tax=Oikopleura dioica TaxID=34765 RepID=E4WXV1_OIKDI|nr:unnamed protein product [Oikopleura dioica]